MFFFFQAEDGIRDGRVTGVQTCALPIWPRVPADPEGGALPLPARLAREAERRPTGTPRVEEVMAALGRGGLPVERVQQVLRSEERRVGKGGRARWGAGRWKKRRGGGGGG